MSIFFKEFLMFSASLLMLSIAILIGMVSYAVYLQKDTPYFYINNSPDYYDKS